MKVIISLFLAIFCSQISLAQGNIYFNGNCNVSNRQLTWKFENGKLSSRMNNLSIVTEGGTTFKLSDSKYTKIELKRTYDGHYMLLINVNGKKMCLDAGGNGGETPYWHPNPDEGNNWHKFKLIEYYEKRDTGNGSDSYVTVMPPSYYVIKNVQSNKCLDANTFSR